MKKVLFIVEAMGGGIFTYIVDLANALTEHYDIYVAYSVRKQTPLDYESYFDKRVHLIRVKHFTRQIRLSEDCRAFFEIRRIAKHINPDIIHLHSSIAGALGRIAFCGSKTPLFYTPHGYYFLTEGDRNVKKLFYWLTEYVCAKTRCVTISCSAGEHQQTLNLTSRATYVDNGISTHELCGLTAAPRNERSFTVFTLGRICYQKNPTLFNKIAESMPDIHFVWIGDGELRSELTAENIEITGWVDRHKALEYSMQGDVFILTSRWEGLSMSLLEAMYLKKPCVVSNCTGNRDVIQDGRNGFLCGGTNQYIKAILKAKDESMENITDAAFKDVCDRHSISSMAQQYRTIYEKGIDL